MPWLCLRLSARHIVVCMLIAAVTGSCGVNVLEKKKKKVTATPPPPAPPLPPPAEPIKPEPVPVERLIRRVSLDLLHELPSARDTMAVRENTARTQLTIDALVMRAEAATGIADLHRVGWGLSASRLPDIDRFLATSEATLTGTNAVTAASTPHRQRLIDEPIQMLRRLILHDIPLSRFFESALPIQHSTLSGLAGFWGTQAEESAFPGESWKYVTYLDNRPAAGILATNGLMAAFDSEGRSDLRARTAKLLGRLTCQDFDIADAHTFTTLTDDLITDGLAETAAQASPCAGCHAQYHAPAKAFAGLASGTRFVDWKEYRPNGIDPTRIYAGREFTGLEGLASLISEDPRFQRCEMVRLQEALLHRPWAAARDTDQLVALQRTLDEAGGSIRAAVRRALSWDAYRFDLTGDKITDEKTAATYSGARFLSRKQWQGIVRQFTSSVAADTFVEGVESGADEDFGRDWRTPSGSYWHAIDKLAHEAAAAIVADELADNVTLQGRRLFLKLPNGSGKGASGETVRAQIRDLWWILTARILDDGSEQLARLETLWSAVAEGGALDTPTRSAWQTVLTGMLLSPDFLMY